MSALERIKLSLGGAILGSIIAHLLGLTGDNPRELVDWLPAIIGFAVAWNWLQRSEP